MTLAQLELRGGFAVTRPVPRHWHEEYQLCLIQAGTRWCSPAPILSEPASSQPASFNPEIR